MTKLTVASSTKGREDDRPGRIMQAALHLFAEQSVAGTDLQQVADRAGVTLATIHLYYEGKEDLFFALIRKFAVGQINRNKQMVNDHQGSSADLIRGLLLTVGRLMIRTDLGTVVKLITSEARNFPEVSAYYVEEVATAGLQKFISVIERGIADGEFRQCDAAHVAGAAIFPALMGAIWMNSIGPHDLIDPEKLLTLNIDALLASIAC